MQGQSVLLQQYNFQHLNEMFAETRAEVTAPPVNETSDPLCTVISLSWAGSFEQNRRDAGAVHMTTLAQVLLLP